MKVNIRFINLLIIFVLFILSLSASIVLFALLDSCAQIENDYIKLSGSAAGFVIFFMLFRKTYFYLIKYDNKNESISKSREIKLLEDRLKSLLLENMDVPNEFKSEISNELKFGFCYPDTWQFNKFPQTIHYGTAIDIIQGKKTGFSRNVVVSISKIYDNKYELKKSNESDRKKWMSLYKDSKFVSEEEILHYGKPAIKQQITYKPENDVMVGYQFQIYDKINSRLFTITFTTIEDDFEHSKPIFDNILSTFKI